MARLQKINGVYQVVRYLSANEYFKSIFGKKVIKLAIDAGFTCPNRDGTLSSKGCIFCSGRGSGDFTFSKNFSVSRQIEEMKSFMGKKWKNGVYMAYFQAFTNTYAPLDILREKYFEAANCEDIAAISIATRPDCINEDIAELLGELNQKAKVFAELGLQTSNESTAIFINRCYKNEVYENAVKMLKAKGINVITHIIIGLPNESKEDWESSVDYAVKCGTDGIKLQLLHVLKNTELEKMYLRNEFKVLEFDEYINAVCECIKRLPKNIVVHRMTGDGAKKDLIAPLWSCDKKKVLNALNKKLNE